MKFQILPTLKKVVKSPYAKYGALAAVAIALPTPGFCATEYTQIESMNSTLTELLSNKILRTTLILASGGWGLVRMVQTGSVAPLIKWMGIGVAAAFIPKIASFLGGIG